MKEPVEEVAKKASQVVTVITWLAATAIVVVLCVVLYSIWRQFRPY